jgi:hypothetical protein
MQLIKKLSIVIIICLIMGCFLYFITSFTISRSGQSSQVENIGSNSEQELQLQINDLSHKLSELNVIVGQIQTQTKAISTPNSSSPNERTINEIKNITSNTNNLSTEVDSLEMQLAELQNNYKSQVENNIPILLDSLQEQVTNLQNKLKATETTIGNSSTTINGLNIIFITNNLEIKTTSSSIQNDAQFAIKIFNNTNSAITNIDLTGTITSSKGFLGNLAVGYPKLADGAGLCSYVFYVDRATILHYEAFGSGKTSLSIPVNGSITLRPKLSLLAAKDNSLPAMNVNIALDTLSYDKITAK